MLPLLATVVDTGPLPRPRASLFPPVHDALSVERAGARRTRRRGTTVHLPSGFEAEYEVIAARLHSVNAGSSKCGFFVQAVDQKAAGVISGRKLQVVVTRL